MDGLQPDKLNDTLNYVQQPQANVDFRGPQEVNPAHLPDGDECRLPRLSTI